MTGWWTQPGWRVGLPSSISACSCLPGPWGSTISSFSPRIQYTCVWFWFCFLNNNIYNMAGGSFVFSRGSRGGLGWMLHTGQQRALVYRIRLPPFVWLEPTHSGSPAQASELASPRQRTDLLRLLFIPWLSSPSFPMIIRRRQSQAWCFKPLLKGEVWVSVQRE